MLVLCNLPPASVEAIAASVALGIHMNAAFCFATKILTALEASIGMLEDCAVYVVRLSVSLVHMHTHTEMMLVNDQQYRYSYCGCRRSVASLSSLFSATAAAMLVNIQSSDALKHKTYTSVEYIPYIPKNEYTTYSHRSYVAYVSAIACIL